MGLKHLVSGTVLLAMQGVPGSPDGRPLAYPVGKNGRQVEVKLLGWESWSIIRRGSLFVGGVGISSLSDMRGIRFEGRDTGRLCELIPCYPRHHDYNSPWWYQPSLPTSKPLLVSSPCVSKHIVAAK